MRRAGLLLSIVGLALVAVLLVPLGPAGGVSASVGPTASSTTVTGTVTYPSVVSLRATATLSFLAHGGPAFAANGTQVGNLSYYAAILGTNLSGVTLAPLAGRILGNTSDHATLSVSNISQTLTLNVMFSSVYQGQNESVNYSYTIAVVQPYVVAATIVNPTASTVLPFRVAVELDGTPVGSVLVPSLTPGAEYNLSFQYAVANLGSGTHTFSISLASEHGLVTFSGGATQYSQSFYIEGGAPNYTLWYALGIVAFVVVLFIFVTRVAARRRGAVRR